MQNQSETYTRSITANPEYEFTGIYSEQGITRYSEKRPGFQSMIDDAMKGVKGCSNRSIDENTNNLACEGAYNTILKDKSKYKKKWEILSEFGNPLEQYRAVQFADMTEREKHIKEIDIDFILRTLNSIKVSEPRKIILRFLDGTDDLIRF